MQYFERQNDSLIFRLNGETVMVSPWEKTACARGRHCLTSFQTTVRHFFLRQKVSLLSNSGNVRL